MYGLLPYALIPYSVAAQQAAGGGPNSLAATLTSANTLTAGLTVTNKLVASLSSANTLASSLTVRHGLQTSLVSATSLSAYLTVIGRVFPIDVTGIPDGTYPVALFNHSTGDFISRQSLTFSAGHAELSTVLTLGTAFSGYVIDPAATPANGAVIFGQVSNAS